MPEPIIRTENYVEGYRLTTTTGGLQIDTIRADPRQLRLDLKQVARLGLRLTGDRYIEAQPGQKAAGIVDNMRESLSRAIDLMKLQERRGSWKWDIDNLKRAWMVLDGLDEKGAQKILDEKKGKNV